mgnify:CR=1 FL=1
MDFYGTIGPACADVKLLQQMVEAGMTGIRMNLSHGPLAAHKDWLVMLHKAGVKKLLIDLQGPELRIGRLPQPLSLTAGNDLLKSCSIARFERKYFAGQSSIKISDNIHSPPLLWDTVIGAVKTTPFQTVPQLMNRGEDRSESFPLGVIE